MTTCQDWLTDLTHAANRILNEDLAALKRLSEDARLDRYERIADDEEEFRWEFTKECDGFLTGAEENRLRGELRLARLLLAASFYADGEVPEAIAGDFIDAELQAVVEFDRFKQFDALDEEQIEQRVRRLDGDLAELIEEYATTQIANIDALLDDPEVQQDVVERLLERYEDRRERIRQGVFCYAETHGLDGVAAGMAGDAAEVAGSDGGDAAAKLTGPAGPTNADTVHTPDGAHTNQSERNERNHDHDGSDVVTAATARLFELDYLGRFETTMYETDRVERPEGSFSVPEDYWDGRRGRRDEADRLDGLLDDMDGSVGDREAYPLNPTARYEITAAKYLGLSSRTRMVIEAAVYSHLAAHANRGFDATPAGIDDLVSVVSNGLEETADDTPYLLGIASPTGWTERVIDHVEHDELSRSRYGRNVSVFLIDLRRGELIYDDADALVADNTHLFKRAVHAEAVANCVSLLRAEYLSALGRDSVLLTEVVDDGEFDRHIVKQAFARLESEGDAEQFYLDEQGLALDFD